MSVRVANLPCAIVPALRAAFRRRAVPKRRKRQPARQHPRAGNQPKCRNGLARADRQSRQQREHANAEQADLFIGENRSLVTARLRAGLRFCFVNVFSSS